MQRVLYWFSNDLRVQQNDLLSSVVHEASNIDWVYVLDTKLFQSNAYGLSGINHHQLNLIRATLIEINQILTSFGSHLSIYLGDPCHCLAEHIEKNQIDTLVVNCHPGFNEQQNIAKLKKQLKQTRILIANNSSLLVEHDLPFTLDNLPSSFTAFRKLIEGADCIQSEVIPPILSLPPRCSHQPFQEEIFNQLLIHCLNDTNQLGGETTANQALNDYFNSPFPKTYKATRNTLSGESGSTRFSHWLSIGSLSPKTIWQALKVFELEKGANESTYWIGFELLWREYFYWYALKYQKACFAFGGIRRKKPLTSFYPYRFKLWCEGNTPFALVNAIMKQLNSTGYISNRARQITASCFVNELDLDWRYGAAYFDQKLIDADVASNWGNWQYIAGVGADPRGGRKFNLAKQQQIYDPDETYINFWEGNKYLLSIDTMDPSDWPIDHERKY